MYPYIKDYPRPQMNRKHWKNLNGRWKFVFDDQNVGESLKWQSTFPAKSKMITVPFTYETKNSGIGDESRHDNLWYDRTFIVNKNDKRLLLHFEGCDYRTKVWVNGQYVGSHEGAYSRFSFDITEQIKNGKNELTVKVEDSFSLEQPRGKQRWDNKNFSCWYVQTTGIWKTVWLESVPLQHISSVKITPFIQKSEVAIVYAVNGMTDSDNFTDTYWIHTCISFNNHIIVESSTSLSNGVSKQVINIENHNECTWGIHLWSPESPDLYDVQADLFKNGQLIDQIFSYFGMREIRAENGNILLNGSPLYQKLILDQGYWKNSHLTPPDEQTLIDDIDKIHAMGFNGLRKHMKVEDERFLYWCDVKGMLVWSEMAAFYSFTDKAQENYLKEWEAVVKQNYNHPCIIVWTPFNESWGIPNIETDTSQQNFTQAVYYLTKSLDSMRLVISNDGWEHTVSDIVTLHDYEENADMFLERYQSNLNEIMDTKIYHNGFKSAFSNGFHYHGQPVMISEYGGIAFNKDDTNVWAYGNRVNSQEEFINRLMKSTDAIKKLSYVVGYCYTQLYDVQQEKNGLLDEDGQYKIDPKKIFEINAKRVTRE